MMERFLLSVVLGCALGAVGLVHADPPEAEGPTENNAEQPPVEDDELGDLDDLLGLAEEADMPRKGDELPDDPTQSELDRKLSGKEIAEAFAQAIQLMSETGQRLSEAKDTGRTTQRMQEDIIRKLDQLIQAVEQQQQSSSSSSGSSSSNNQGSQPNQQQQQSSQAGSGDNRSETTPPGRAEGPRRPSAGLRGAAWGSLPARLRDALFQGSADDFSAMYRQLTESYYKRLAEEASK